MNRKTLFLILVLLLNPILASGTTTVYRPNDSVGAPENNLDTLYVDETGEVHDFSLSIPVISLDSDIVSMIAFRNVNITLFDHINEANLSLNFQLDFQSSPLPLEITIYGYDSSLGTGTFPESIGLSAPLTTANVVVDLQNIMTPGYVDIDITEIVQEIVNTEYWTSGDTIGLITYGIQRARARSYQSNYGINRPKLSVRYGEQDYTPEEEGGEWEFNETYKNWDIWYFKETVNFWGLANPNYWVSLPVTLVTGFGEVDEVNASTYDSEWIPNAEYTELWTDQGYEGNYYKNLFHTGGLWNGISDVSRCDSVRDGNIKVNIFGFERTWGSQVAGEYTIGFIGGFSKLYSGDWIGRYSNNAPMVATRIRSYTTTQIQLDGDAQLATELDHGPTLYLDENKVYIMRYEVGFNPYKYGGSKYYYHYLNRFYSLNGTTGAVGYVGKVECHFNMTEERWNALNKIELIESYGTGSHDAYIEFYISRGFIPEKVYKSEWRIIPANETDPVNNTCLSLCLADAVTIADVEECIDICLEGGGTPDDPSPGGWEDEGPFRRSRIRLYLFLIGWLTFWIPWFILPFMSGSDKMIYFWICVMCSVIGLALLWSIPQI